MKKVRSFLPLAASAAIVVGGLVSPSGPADAAVQQCGGQNWHAQAPLTCTKTKVIDGTAVTIVLTETGAGFTTITYTLDSPRQTDTLIHATSHLGNSDAGGPSTDPGGVIPAGSLGPVTLVIPQAACGQLDLRAIFNNKSGRVSGPYILTSNCQVPTTTTTSPPTSTPGSSQPPSSPPVTTPPSAVPGPHPPRGGTITPPGTLPATGSGSGMMALSAIGVLSLCAGLLILLGRRQPRMS